MTKKLFLAIITLALFNSGAARASSVLLDTITSAFDPNGGLVVGQVPSGPNAPFQSSAIFFSTASSAQTITSIEAFIGSPSGHDAVTLGIMASAANGAPTGTFLDVQTVPVVQLGSSPVTINNLNWSLAANTTYWLVATTPAGFDVWNRGSLAGTEAGTSSPTAAGPWSLGTVPGGEGLGLPEALVTGVAVTPLPPAFPMFVGGLAMLGLLGWRKRRTQTATMMMAS